MTSALLTSLGVLVLAYGFFQYQSLQRNIRAAKKSGFKYVISPVYFQSIPWLILQEPLRPFLVILPSSWTDSWLPLSIFARIWHEGHEPFRKLDSDTVLMVSPTANILWTCDAEVIAQISTRRNDFSKAVEMLGLLNIYGPTITASDGEEHRIYQKVAAHSFNDENYIEVWRATIEQTEQMVEEWRGNENVILDVKADSSKLALHVISKVFFGESVSWRGKKDSRPGPGHTLTYEKAISSMTEHNGTIFMTPRPILNHSPLKAHKLAKEAFLEWGKYMEEMRDTTTQNLQKHELTEGGTLLENFVKAGTPSPNTQTIPISPKAVLGNIFIFILAGHETSANAFTIAATLLACRPSFQKALQSDIDLLLGGRTSKSWSYKTDFAPLMRSRVGALMKEVTRLYSVIPFLPKTNKSHPQPLRIGSQTHLLPPSTLILLNLNATHRNPKYYPTAPSQQSKSPLADFNPDRWLPSHPDGFNPPEGAYLPFSSGTRACMGQRFAEVEFCAAITGLFAGWSVELDVKPGGSWGWRRGSCLVGWGLRWR